MFENIYENEHPKKLIQSMLEKNRLSHTIILAGDNGLGKLTFAKNIALEIIYGKNGFKKNCIENCIDITIIDGDEKGSILINDIRELRSKLNTTPHEGEKKVQIIANCDNMTTQAQNALLKSLEEPSPTTVFILTVSNSNRLLNTISSRATIINMNPLSELKTIEILSNLYPSLNINEIKRYVKIFGGNLGIYEELFKNLDSLDVLDICENLLFYTLIQNEHEIMSIFSKYEKDKHGLILLLTYFKLFFIKILKNCLNDKNIEIIVKNSQLQTFILQKNNLTKKIYIVNLIDKSLEYITLNVNIKLILAWLNSNFIKYSIK